MNAEISVSDRLVAIAKEYQSLQRHAAIHPGDAENCKKQADELRMEVMRITSVAAHSGAEQKLA